MNRRRYQTHDIFGGIFQEDYQDKLSKVLHETVKVPDYFEKSESKADLYDKGIKVFLQVDTGSVANLKPELVMEAFLNI